MNTQLIKIGIISGTNGLNGAVSIAIDNGYMKFLKQNEFVFIELSPDTFVPYQLLTIKKNDDENALISFEEFDSIESAKTINGKSLFLDKNKLPKNAQNFVGAHLTDFELIDFHSAKQLGKINAIYELPQQVMAELIIEGKEVLIPLINEFIIEINPTKQFIKINLPEGLLDI